MMCPDPRVKAVYLYPKPVDFRKSINGLVALVELDIKVAVFDPVLFVFLNRTRNQVKILYWHRNGFCLWLKRLEAERFKTKPDEGDQAIECARVESATGGNRPLGQPTSQGTDATFRDLIRYNPRHDFHARNPSRRSHFAEAASAVAA